jgi:O-antigen/teichoic acid export membrane protein
MHETNQGVYLAKEEIRLQYSGLVIFAAKMLSVVTGLVFQVMLARAIIEPKEYDVWFNINDMLTYFTLLAGVIPFWVMRFVARGKEGSIKTGIMANITISVVAIIVYVPLISLITSALNIGGQYLPLYFIVALQIIEIHLANVLETCLRAKTPHVIGYGLLISEVCKVILGYILIVEYHQPLFGALVSIIVAFAIQTIYYLRLLLPEFKQKVQWEYVKEWLRGSLASIYNVAGNQIAAFIFIMLFVYGGDGGRSRYGLAAQVANIITYSSFLAFALYPKLLTERKREDITTSLKMVLMFALPMTAGAVALADSYIIIMRGEYVDAQFVLAVLAIDALVATVSGLFSSVLFGVERVDEKAKISLKALFRSRLFVLFSLPYFHAAITLPTASYILANYAQNQPFQAALYVSVINATARFAMFLILYAVVRKMIEIDIPWRKIANYTFASLVMGTVLFVLPHPTRIAITLLMTGVGGAIYLALLVAIDKEARLLAKSVGHGIRSKIAKIV